MCVRYEDLADIALLDFSYGGMVVAGALVDIADRVRLLVFLDAFVPSEGDTTLGLMGYRSAAPGLATVRGHNTAPALADGVR